MENEKTCPHMQQLPEKPTADELVRLRRNGWKRRRKAKHPKIRTTGGRHASLGWFTLEAEKDDYSVTFAVNNDKTEGPMLLSALCDNDALADLRFRFGWLVADLCDLDGLHVMEAIPGPNEAMSESSPYFNAAYDWRRWAIG